MVQVANLSLHLTETSARLAICEGVLVMFGQMNSIFSTQ